MSSYHQHSDGQVYVRAQGKQYVDTVENFRLDFGRSTPELPALAAERLYDTTPGNERHVAFDVKGNQVAASASPWSPGEDVIADIDAALAAQAERAAAEAVRIAANGL